MIAKNKKPIPSEHEEQVHYFKLIELYKARYPDLAMIAAIPNGGYRKKRNARNLRLEGVSAGFSDIIICVARKGYHGAFIEMKRRDGGMGMSMDQKIWFEKLSDQGYLCFMAKGCDPAWEFTKWYLGIHENI